MRYHKWAKIICLLIAMGLTKACDYDLSFSSAQTEDIGFSSDTVYLDTVFTQLVLRPTIFEFITNQIATSKLVPLG